MSDKTLWDYAVLEREKAEKAIKAGKTESALPIENTLLVCGSKESGKSSLLLRYLDRDETPKPTVALDYNFARKPKEHGTAKDVCHIWELGGGTSMTEMFGLAITAKNVRNLAILLVLDLSQPNQLWKTQEMLLAELRKAIDDAINAASKEDPSLPKFLAAKTAERIGTEHGDENLINPFPVPLAIVGGRYDTYQEMEPEPKKMLSKALRFIAHLNGAYLLFYSTKADGLNNKGRLLVGKLAFDSNCSKSVVTDYNKPVCVPFGQDSMEQIGAPPIAPENLLRVKGGTPYDLWKESFAEFFPPEKKDNAQAVLNLALDRQYAEAAVDSMRAQKDEELQRYRKMSERKSKASSSNMDSSGRVKKK